VSVQEFCDDDAGYLAWLATHPDGYVINLARSRNPSDARTHQADCGTISGEIPRGRAWTETYIKVCAEHLGELEKWAADTYGPPIAHCGNCRPTHRTG